MGLSKELAQYVKKLQYEDVPAKVVEYTKLCVLDYFASAIAGTNTRPIRMIDEMVREMGGHGQATMISGGKTSVSQAALLNGSASHIIELDDIHKSSIIHAGTVIIPAALAVSEWQRSSGPELITAIIAGYEIAYRIGETVSPSHYYFWHNTATCGTFGASVAAAKLMNLTVDEIVHSLGSAGTQAAGLWEFIEDGAMSKQLHPGKAAMNGVISALLAAKGFTGATKIIEGNRGFVQAMSKANHYVKITKGLGEQFKITENSFKIHASCRHTHHVMDLMIELHKNNELKLNMIKDITVKTYKDALQITNNHQPETVYAAKFSLQYCTALALVKGEGGPDQFNEKSLWDPLIRNLMERVTLEVDQQLEQNYPEKWGAIVSIKLVTGETIVKQTDYPLGDPENSVTEHELLTKFNKLTKILPKKKQEEFSKLIMELENLANIEPLMKYLEYNRKEKLVNDKRI